MTFLAGEPNDLRCPCQGQEGRCPVGDWRGGQPGGPLAGTLSKGGSHEGEARGREELLEPPLVCSLLLVESVCTDNVVWIWLSPPQHLIKHLAESGRKQPCRRRGGGGQEREKRGERGAEGEEWGLREEEGGREGTGQERGDTKRQMNGWEREGGGGRSTGRKRSGRRWVRENPMLPALGKCSPQASGKPSFAGTEGCDSKMGTQARWAQGQLALCTAT